MVTVTCGTESSPCLRRLAIISAGRKCVLMTRSHGCDFKKRMNLPRFHFCTTMRRRSPRFLPERLGRSRAS